MITQCSLPVAMASALAAGLLIAPLSPARANLVSDPGFESCIPPGGPGETPPDWSGTAICAGRPHSGTWAAGFASPSATLSQSIATTPGDTYDFSFWLESPDPPQPPNSFTASFGSDVVLNLTNVFPFHYTFEDFTVTAAAASTTISFTASTPAPGTFWFLDDVSVTAVPAPALSPLGPALVGLFLLARRAYRRRQA